MPSPAGIRLLAALLAVDWGPVGVWVSAAITLLAVIVTALIVDPGFATTLRLEGRHTIKLTVFSNIVDSQLRSLNAGLLDEPQGASRS